MNITLELDPPTVGKTLAAAFAQATGAGGKWKCEFKVEDGKFKGVKLTLDEHPGIPPAPSPEKPAERKGCEKCGGPMEPDGHCRGPKFAPEPQEKKP